MGGVGEGRRQIHYFSKNFIVKNFRHKKTCIEAGHQTHHKSQKEKNQKKNYIFILLFFQNYWFTCDPVGHHSKTMFGKGIRKKINNQVKNQDI